MGALRRADPVPSSRPFSKRSRGAAPAACGATARESSIRRVGADQKLSAPTPKYTKIVRNGIVVEMEKKSARCAGADEGFLVPSPKRAKVSVETPVDPALGTLRKRMAAELDVLHGLMKKAELLSTGKDGRFMAAAEPRPEAPAAKRKKVSADSALAKIAEFESPEDDNDFIDICGGVSPVAFQNASPTFAVDKAGETAMDPPEDEDELVDICGGVSPVMVEKPCEIGNSPSSSTECGSSSSSDSDSDSHSDETIDMPVPPVVLPDENGTSAHAPPEPASEIQQSTEPEKLKDKKRAAPMAISKAIEKAKVRRTLLEMERAVLPNESIHTRDLKDLCIAEYGRPSIMRQLGLVLKADA